MTTHKVDIDVQLLKSEIRKTYASVSQEPEKDFAFPTGRAGNLVATYMRSKFEDTRRKALKFGAHGTTVKAYKAMNTHRAIPMTGNCTKRTVRQSVAPSGVSGVRLPPVRREWNG